MIHYGMGTLDATVDEETNAMEISAAVKKLSGSTLLKKQKTNETEVQFELCEITLAYHKSMTTMSYESDQK